MFSSALQLEKTLSPIEVTLAPISMLFKASQSANAEFAIALPEVILTLLSLLFFMYAQAIAGIIAFSIGQ